VSETIRPDVLFGAAKLTATDVDDFTNLPTHYLDACLTFGSKRVPCSPRCTLIELIGAIGLADLKRIQDEILRVRHELDYIDLEASFFLMYCLAYSAKTSLPEIYLTSARDMLRSDSPPAFLAATLLMCLSSDERNSPFQQESLQLANLYTASDAIVTLHAAVKLFWPNIERSLLNDVLIMKLIELLLNLAENSWHTHLLPMFSYLVTLESASLHQEAEPLFIALWTRWCEAEPENASDFIIILHSLFEHVPKESGVTYQAACILGNWLVDLPEGRSPSEVMDLAIMIVRRLDNLPPEFINVLSFCHNRLYGLLLEPFSEICTLLIQYFPDFQDGICSAMIHDICSTVLRDEEAGPELLSRMLIVSACLVQTLGPPVASLIDFAFGRYDANEPGSPIWSSALVVLLSAVILSLSWPDFREGVVRMNLDSWFTLVRKEEHRFRFCRLSVMSIVAFFVLGAFGNQYAVPLAFHQFRRLTNDKPDGELDALERLSLPFDSMNLYVVLSSFLEDHMDLVNLSSEDVFHVCSARDQTDDQFDDPPVRFEQYLATFNRWL
jgi:hypothetical protein